MIQNSLNTRATIIKNGDSFEIRIPPKVKVFDKVFILIWLCGWCAAEVTVMGNVLRSESEDTGTIIWLTFWTIGGLFAILTMLWYFGGSEVIAVDQGMLRIRKEIFGIGPTREFEISKMKYMRLNLAMDESHPDFFAHGKIRKAKEGAIRFDYSQKIIKFGVSIEEHEAQRLIEAFKLNLNFKDLKF